MVEVGIIVALTLKGTYIGDYEKLREIAPGGGENRH